MNASEIVYRAYTGIEKFRTLLDAATIPTDGGRKIHGIANAVALSEVRNLLAADLEAAREAIVQPYRQQLLLKLPPGVVSAKLIESDSPDGPWTEIPQSEMKVTTYPIGGDGADALLLAAIDGAMSVLRIPLDSWNAMQAAQPGANHERWHCLDVISTDQVAALESAAKMLRVRQTKAGEDGGSATAGRDGNGKGTHAGFTPGALADLIGVSTETINAHAKAVGVETPGRGRRNHRYTLDGSILILQGMCNSATDKATREKCKNILAELEKYRN